jgi:hypothetical protein
MAMPTKRQQAVSEAPDLQAQEQYQEPSSQPSESMQAVIPTVVGEVVDAFGSTAAPRTRGPSGNHLWQPGQSGNPSGRRKVDPQVKKLLIEATPRAAQELIDLMTDKKVSPRIRCEAAQAILDRVYGKAVQPIDATVEGDLRMMVVKFEGALEQWAK